MMKLATFNACKFPSVLRVCWWSAPLRHRQCFHTCRAIPIVQASGTTFTSPYVGAGEDECSARP